MPVEIISGPFYNALGRGVPYGATPTAAVTLSTGTINPSFPASALYDGIVASPTILAAKGSWALDVGLNLVQCGDGEQATAVGWSVSAGLATIVTSATAAYKGAKSLKVTTSAAAGHAYQEITVQAGERLALHLALNVTGGGLARFEIFDPQTARWLNSSGQWVASSTFVFLSAAASWVVSTGAFTVPTHDVWYAPTGTLKISIYASDAPAGGECYAECLVSPEIDYLGFVGHNLPPDGSVTATSYADWWHGGAATVEATLTLPKRPVAWHSMATPIRAPFLRLSVTSTAGDFPQWPWVGELLLGRRQVLTGFPDYPVRVEVVHPQERNTTRGGTTWAMATARYPTRQFSMPFDASAAAAAEIETIGLMTRGGQTPVVILPTDSHPNVCILGRLAQNRRADLVNFARTSTEMVVVEEALPSLE